MPRSPSLAPPPLLHPAPKRVLVVAWGAGATAAAAAHSPIEPLSHDNVESQAATGAGTPTGARTPGAQTE